MAASQDQRLLFPSRCAPAPSAQSERPIQTSLGTKILSEAKRLAPRKAAEVEKQFRDAETVTSQPKSEPSAATIQRLAEIHLAQVLEEDEEVREEGLTERDYRKEAEALEIVDMGGRYDLARDDLTIIEDDVEELLTQNALTLDKVSLSY